MATPGHRGAVLESTVPLLKSNRWSECLGLSIPRERWVGEGKWLLPAEAASGAPWFVKDHPRLATTAKLAAGIVKLLQVINQSVSSHHTRFGRDAAPPSNYTDVSFIRRHLACDSGSAPRQKQ